MGDVLRMDINVWNQMHEPEAICTMKMVLIVSWDSRMKKFISCHNY